MNWFSHFVIKYILMKETYTQNLYCVREDIQFVSVTTLYNKHCESISKFEFNQLLLHYRYNYKRNIRSIILLNKLMYAIPLYITVREQLPCIY